MSPKARLRLSIIWRITVAVIGLAAVVIVTAQRYNYGSFTKKQAFVAAVVAAGLAAIDGLVGVRKRLRARAREDAKTRAQKILMGLLVEISDANAIGVQDLGASAWVMRWRYRWRMRKWWPKKVLVRVVRFRLDENPQPTQVDWTKGKGAIGSCWATQRIIHRDWRVQASQHSDPGLPLQTFSALDAGTQDGFAHGEFVAIAPKYTETLAVPVMSEGSGVIGVVSIDVSARASLTDLIFGDAGVQDAADKAAALLSEDLDQLYPLS